MCCAVCCYAVLCSHTQHADMSAQLVHVQNQSRIEVSAARSEAEQLQVTFDDDDACGGWGLGHMWTVCFEHAIGQAAMISQHVCLPPRGGCFPGGLVHTTPQHAIKQTITCSHGNIV